MDGAEIFAVHMRVELRGREVGMAEHLLHRAEIGATLEQMGCERMSQRMGCDALGQPGAPGGRFDDAPGPDA